MDQNGTLPWLCEGHGHPAGYEPVPLRRNAFTRRAGLDPVAALCILLMGERFSGQNLHIYLAKYQVVSPSAARRKGLPGAAAAHVRRGELLPVATIRHHLAAHGERLGKEKGRSKA